MNTVIKKTHQIDRLSKKYLPLLIILQCYTPIVDAIHLGKLTQIYQYGIYGILALFSLFYFWVHRGHIVNKYPQLSALYIFMILYVVAACVKLCYVPSSIFFYQRLVVFAAFLSVGSVFLLMQDGVIKRTFRMWWRFVPWITILSIPIGVISYKIMVLFFVFFFLILSECLRKQLRFLTYALVAIIVFFFIVQRMDYLYVLAPFSVFFMIKNHLFMSTKKSVAIYHFLMCVPLFFLLLALFSGFNILNFDSYIKGDYKLSTGENLKDDTRTFLYEESIESALKHNYVVWGRTPGYGYDSKFARTREGDFLEVEGLAAQRNSEVFVVNIFTWCGVIGLIAWFAFYYWFGINTLRRVKNSYIRGLVIYIGMLWVLNWINNPFVTPDNYNMLVYIILSLCIQPKFRNMSDEEIRYFFKRMLR